MPGGSKEGGGLEVKSAYKAYAPFKMKAADYNNSPVQKNFGTSINRGFGTGNPEMKGIPFIGLNRPGVSVAGSGVGGGVGGGATGTVPNWGVGSAVTGAMQNQDEPVINKPKQHGDEQHEATTMGNAERITALEDAFRGDDDPQARIGGVGGQGGTPHIPVARRGGDDEDDADDDWILLDDWSNPMIGASGTGGGRGPQGRKGGKDDEWILLDDWGAR